MNLINFFKSRWETAKEPAPEVVERKIPIIMGRYQVRVKIFGKELYLEDFLRTKHARKGLCFSRFYLMEEHPIGIHFAPTLEMALDWFSGKKVPNDGYLSIDWGKNYTSTCPCCGHHKMHQLHVTKVEKAVISIETPLSWQFEGWRVSEVEAEEIGKGIPSKAIGLYKTYPIIKWHSRADKYICRQCAKQLKEISRKEDLICHPIH